MDLYPVFEVDEEEEVEEEEDVQYGKDYTFDFATGEFVKDSNGEVKQSEGSEAWLQWCNLLIRTERYACLAYPDDIGVELEDCIGLTDKEDAELQMETSIKEALLADPEGRTESVEDFSFRWGSDSVYVECTVESTSGIVAVIGTEYSNKRMEGEKYD